MSVPIAAVVALLLWAGGRASEAPAKPIPFTAAAMGGLEELPVAQPATAKGIIKFRQKSSPFLSTNDLLATPGMSETRLETAGALVTIEPPAPEPHPNPPAVLPAKPPGITDPR